LKQLADDREAEPQMPSFGAAVASFAKGVPGAYPPGSAQPRPGAPA
jgi:hypothetical protein